MKSQIPNPVIGTIAPIIADYYYNHSTLDSLFRKCGAPGDVPTGNCEKKCSDWLIRCSENEGTDALLVLGKIIKDFMNKKQDPVPSLFDDGPSKESEIATRQEEIRSILSEFGLSYISSGIITFAGVKPSNMSLPDRFSSGDYKSIEEEFERTNKYIRDDPKSAVTASCAIIEACLKWYLEKNGKALPSQLNVKHLWEEVRKHLSLNANGLLAADQSQILKGLTSVIDGIACFRSHAGSAHGREINSPEINLHEAKLAVNSSHTIVIFLMDTVLHES